MNNLRYSIGFIVSFFVLGGFICGYVLSVIAGASPLIQKEFGLSIAQVSTIIGLIFFGGLLVKIVMVVNDYFNRKAVILVTFILYIAGILIFTMGHSYSMLYLGRFIQGCSIIMGSVIFPVYLSEIAPSKSRGVVITFFQLAWTAGMLFANIINFGLYKSGNWQMMFNIMLVFPVILIILVPFLPKSPRWLVLRGEVAEAEEIISRINKGSDKEALAREVSLLVKGEKVSWGESFKLISTYKKGIFLAASVLILTQFCGINAIMQTSTILLKECGIRSDFMAVFGSILLTGINFVMTIGTILFVDRIGRKLILKIGLIGFFISLIILGTAIKILPKEELTGWIALACMLIAIGFLAFGPTGVVYVIITEVLPTPVRTIGIVGGGIIAMMAQWIFVSKFLVIGQLFGYHSLFFLMAFFALVYLMFVFFLLPETKSKTLEEIEKEMTKK